MLASLAFVFALSVQDPAPCVQDVAGTVKGAMAGETVRVTVWQYDMNKTTVEPIADGKADANGTFAFAKTPWVRTHDWGFCSMLVVARAGERAIGLLEVRGDHVDCKHLAVELLPATTMAGVVRGPKGEPVAGAWLEPWAFQLGADDKSRVLLGPNLTWRTQTDAKGQFVVRFVPAGARVDVQVRHPDFAEASVWGADPTQRCTFELQPGGVLMGALRLPDGSAAVRAVVSVQGHRVPFFVQVRTDDAGRYLVRSLPEGVFNVWAESDDFTVVALHAVRVGAGETVKDQDLAFVRGGWIVGRVVDDATGKPVQPGASADVGMNGPARPPETGIQCARVAADGTFRIRAPAGTNHLYLREGNDWTGIASQGDFAVVEGEETKVEFRARRAPAKAK